MKVGARWGVIGFAAAVAASGCGRKSDLEAEQARRSAVKDAALDEARRRAEVTARVRATLHEHVLFGFDDSELGPDARRSLDAKASLLRSDTAIQLVLLGYADEGSHEHNMDLGMRRATAARRHLVRAGIDSARLEVRSHSERGPWGSGNDQGTAANHRRVEFLILNPGRTAQHR